MEIKLSDGNQHKGFQKWYFFFLYGNVSVYERNVNRWEMELYLVVVY